MVAWRLWNSLLFLTHSSWAFSWVFCMPFTVIWMLFLFTFIDSYYWSLFWVSLLYCLAFYGNYLLGFYCNSSDKLSQYLFLFYLPVLYFYVSTQVVVTIFTNFNRSFNLYIGIFINLTQFIFIAFIFLLLFYWVFGVFT